MASKKKQIEVHDDMDIVQEELASTITNMAWGVQQLKAGPIKYDTIIALIQLQCGENKTTIRRVLDAVEDGARFHLKKPPPKPKV